MNVNIRVEFSIDGNEALDSNNAYVYVSVESEGRHIRSQDYYQTFDVDNQTPLSNLLSNLGGWVIKDTDLDLVQAIERFCDRKQT